MVKVIALISRRPDLDHASFDHHWRTVHAPLVWALPGVRRYVQNPVMAGVREWTHDGVAELWFDSVADVRTAFASPQAGPMRDDEQHFIADMTWFLTEERETADTASHDRSEA